MASYTPETPQCQRFKGHTLGIKSINYSSEDPQQEASSRSDDHGRGQKCVSPNNTACDTISVIHMFADIRRAIVPEDNIQADNAAHLLLLRKWVGGSPKSSVSGL